MLLEGSDPASERRLSFGAFSRSRHNASLRCVKLYHAIYPKEGKYVNNVYTTNQLSMLPGYFYLELWEENLRNVSNRRRDMAGVDGMGVPHVVCGEEETPHIWRTWHS